MGAGEPRVEAPRRRMGAAGRQPEKRSRSRSRSRGRKDKGRDRRSRDRRDRRRRSPSSSESGSGSSSVDEKYKRVIKKKPTGITGHPWPVFTLPAPGKSPVYKQELAGNLTTRLVFVSMGQSNMSGRAWIRKADPAHPRVFMLNAVGEWDCAKEPVNPHDGRGEGAGPLMTFARRVLELLPSQLKAGVFLVPSAAGGTCMKHWTRNGPLVAGATQRTLLGAEACEGKIAGMLWHQGEGDSQTEENAKQYSGKLADMVGGLRETLKDPELPFIAGELPYFLDKSERFACPHWRVVNKELQTAADGLIPHMRLAPNHDSVPDNKGPEDFLHMNIDAQKRLGTRYAELWWDMVKHKYPKDNARSGGINWHRR